MVRFIFVCMAVVAVSIIAISAQVMTDGIADATQSVVARNTAPMEKPVQNIASADTELAAQMNAIDTAAGTASFDPSDTFSRGFTNKAPKALGDTTEDAAFPALVTEAR